MVSSLLSDGINGFWFSEESCTEMYKINEPMHSIQGSVTYPNSFYLNLDDL